MNKELKENPDTYIISPEIKKSFKDVLKRGVYKELYQRGLLSNRQLDSLLKDK